MCFADGARADMRTDDGATPLLMAVQHKRVDAMHELLNHARGVLRHCQRYLIDHNVCTANGYLESLLAISTDDGLSYVSAIVQEGDDDILKALLDVGAPANVCLQSPHGRTVHPLVC